MGGPAAPPLDLARLVRALVDREVAFVVVGGVGAAAHGATRRTTDLDVVVQWSRENLTRVAAVLEGLSARLKVPGVGPIDVPIDPRVLKGIRISTSWRTVAGDLDVISRFPAGKGAYVWYEHLVSRSETIVVGGWPVNLAALNDIIVAKETLNRRRDREALPELYRMRASRW